MAEKKLKKNQIEDYAAVKAEDNVFTENNNFEKRVLVGTNLNPNGALLKVAGDTDIGGADYFLIRLIEGSNNVRGVIATGAYALSGGDAAMVGIKGIGGIQFSAGSTFVFDILPNGAMLIGTHTDSGNGQKIQVNGRISQSDAPVQSTDVVRLTDLSGYVNTTTNQTISGIKTIADFLIINDGVSAQNPVSVTQLNATNALILGLEQRVIIRTDADTTIRTDTQLNAAYPTAPIKTFITAPNSTMGPITYQKVTSTHWVNYPGANCAP